MELEATYLVLIGAFLLAVVMGAVANKTNFCTMGAISDVVNMGNTARLSAWLFTIAIAIFGTALLELLSVVNLQTTLPPYRTTGFAWLRYLLGGLLFGIGMTLAGGCGNKTLINIGAGSLRSLFVLLVAGIFAYAMTKTVFYEILFHSWIESTTIDLTKFDMTSQSLPDIFSALVGVDASLLMQGGFAFFCGSIFLYLALKSKSFRKNLSLIIGSAVIGVCVTGGWYLSGGALGQEAIEMVEWMDERPLGVGVQSFTFINPMGESVNYLMQPTNSLLITFGVMALAGVIVGSMLVSVITGTFSISKFTSLSDFAKHLLGGILMGIGGVLAMGCTIGQGVTGVSTLAFGSFIALGSMMFGSAITIKVSYYRMMYEDEEEATFAAMLISSLVDFRLLPKFLRKLEEP